MFKIIDDIRAIYKNDPAAQNIEFVLYPSFHAILFHRFIHWMWKIQVPFLPRMFSQLSRFLTGLEIHPGASIGRGFFVDHGAGVVIGETTIIGDNCVLFHNVTLGGTGKHQGKRHPSIGSKVLIGTGATLLGPLTVGDNVKIGAGSFIYMHDVPSNCTVAGAPARIVKRDGNRVDEALPVTLVDRAQFENNSSD